MNTIIGFGTKSDKKVAAAQAAIAHIGLPLILRGVNTKTGEMEQPLGRFGDPAPFTEGMTGAKTRATESLVLVPEAEYGLGIESQLLEVDMGTYIDLAVACIWKRGDASGIYTTSTGICCPAEYVRESLRAGRRVTAGKIFSAAKREVEHDDWHKHVTGGRLSRDEMLEQAIFAVLALTFPTAT